MDNVAQSVILARVKSIRNILAAMDPEIRAATVQKIADELDLFTVTDLERHATATDPDNPMSGNWGRIS